MEIDAVPFWVKMPFREYISYIGQVRKEIKKQLFDCPRFTTQFTNAELIKKISNPVRLIIVEVP